MEARQVLCEASTIKVESTGPLAVQEEPERSVLLFAERAIRQCSYSSTSRELKFCKIGETEDYVTWADVMQRGAQPGAANGQRVLLSCKDGTLRVMNLKTLQTETTIRAHSREVAAAKWNRHGTSILSGGVDGAAKLWSSAGALRSTLIASSSAILALDWAIDASHVAFSSDKKIYLHDIRQQKNQMKFFAHKGAVVALRWSPAEMLVLCGSEDRRFYLYNERGVQTCSSEPLESGVSALAWTPSGDACIVATKGFLRLCSTSGQTLSKIAVSGGPVRCVSFLDECTVLLGSISRLTIVDVHRRVDVSTLPERVFSRFVQALEGRGFQETDIRNVSCIGAGYGYVVAVVSQLCYVVPEEKSMEVATIDLSSPVKFVKQCQDKFLLLCSGGQLLVYDYNGSLKCTMELSALRHKNLGESQIDIASEAIAILSPSNCRAIDLHSPMSGVLLRSSDERECKIIALQLCHADVTGCPACVFLDECQDLFLLPATDWTAVKLGSCVRDVRYHSDCDILAVVSHRELVLWHLASASWRHRYLARCLKTVICSHVEEDARIASFHGTICTLTSAQAGTSHLSFGPTQLHLHELVRRKEWMDAMRFCRRLYDAELWKTLGARAIIEDEDQVARCALKAAGLVEYALLDGSKPRG